MQDQSLRMKKKWNDGPKHIKLTTVDIWVVYFTYTLTQTLVCILCILTADYTVKPVLSSNLKKKTNYPLMHGPGGAFCNPFDIYQTNIIIKIFVLSS